MTEQSRVTNGVGAPNASTRVLLHDEGPRLPAERLREIYRRAAELVAVDHEARDGALYRLFWSRGDELLSADLGALADGYAILGRHEQCDVRLLDAELSNRHLMIRASALPDGRRELRLMDLRASLPFHLFDARPHRSLIATGAVALRLGRYGLVALPLGSAPSPEPPEPDIGEASDPVRRAASSPDESVVTSRISSIPNTSVLVELGGASPEPGDGVVEVQHAERRALVVVRKDDLAGGVLVGRARRCLDHGVREVLDAAISRAHLLLLEDPDGAFAFDLSSTNGTRHRGRRVRRARLHDEGTELQLGGRSGVRLRWWRRPAEGRA